MKTSAQRLVLVWVNNLPNVVTCGAIIVTVVDYPVPAQCLCDAGPAVARYRDIFRSVQLAKMFFLTVKIIFCEVYNKIYF